MGVRELGASEQEDAASPGMGDGRERPLLEVTQLEVTYHSVVVAVQGVTLSVRPGERVALLGANGAGKTTIVRAVGGFLPGERIEITDGTVTFGGWKANGASPVAAARRGIAIVPERDKCFTTLTVDENLRAVRPRAVSTGVNVSDVFDLFPALASRRQLKAGFLSGGERQMLAIARAVLQQPRLLIADEVSLGISPVLLESILEALSTLSQQTGIGLLLAEQSVASALSITDRGYLIQGGRVVLDGTSSQLRANEDVQEFFLGLRSGGEEIDYASVKQYRRKKRWFG